MRKRHTMTRAFAEIKPAPLPSVDGLSTSVLTTGPRGPSRTITLIILNTLTETLINNNEWLPFHIKNLGWHFMIDFTYFVFKRINFMQSEIVILIMDKSSLW